ncbi:MAG: DUF3870 domain-containing protein [Propionibacteriales bacterium]|nr:DUF3870 domain-containing protein [Propionibacteriales bacterium]
MPELPYVLVAGYARLPQSTGAGVMYQHLTVIAKIESRTSRVLEASTTLATSLADSFVKEHLIGIDLVRDLDRFVEVVEGHYWGNGRKAIIGAVRDLARRYCEQAVPGANVSPDIAHRG